MNLVLVTLWLCCGEGSDIDHWSCLIAYTPVPSIVQFKSYLSGQCQIVCVYCRRSFLFRRCLWHPHHDFRQMATPLHRAVRNRIAFYQELFIKTREWGFLLHSSYSRHDLVCLLSQLFNSVKLYVADSFRTLFMLTQSMI